MIPAIESIVYSVMNTKCCIVGFFSSIQISSLLYSTHTDNKALLYLQVLYLYLPMCIGGSAGKLIEYSAVPLESSKDRERERQYIVLQITAKNHGLLSNFGKNLV